MASVFLVSLQGHHRKGYQLQKKTGPRQTGSLAVSPPPPPRNNALATSSEVAVRPAVLKAWPGSISQSLYFWRHAIQATDNTCIYIYASYTYVYIYIDIYYV